jgi:hypothetical protein
MELNRTELNEVHVRWALITKLERKILRVGYGVCVPLTFVYATLCLLLCYTLTTLPPRIYALFASLLLSRHRR